MPFLTVCVVVLDEDKVLLTKRNDFHVWCLPSGGVEDGETVTEAAIREAKEETGLDVKLTRMVGIYSRPVDIPSLHAVVFAAIPVGGEIHVQPGETLEVRYFALKDLPTELSFGHIRRIRDAFHGISGAVVLQRLFAREQAQAPRRRRVDPETPVPGHTDCRSRVAGPLQTRLAG